jgi:hypothetical protein
MVPYTISTAADVARCVFAVDVDGDGRVDVLSASINDDKIAWYKNGGGVPVVWTPDTITTAANGAVSVYAADVDGDGRLDVLSASPIDDKIAWYKNGGGYPVVWTPFTVTTTADGAHSVYAADVDGDGRVDVLSASWDDDKIAWYRNGGGSSVVWTPYTIAISADGAASVSAADVDGDGRLDVLSASYIDGKIAWYKNGGGSPVTWTSYTISTTANGANSVYAADVDGDGRVDVLSTSETDDIAWHKNGGGSPAVWTRHTISTAFDAPVQGYAADVDGDGRLDVLSASYHDNKIAWHKNGGGFPVVWTPYVISTTADGAWSVYAADVDGDGRVDVLSASGNDDKIAWYKNMMCPRGRFGPGGYAPCSLCPSGWYANTSVQAACDECPAGRFGSGGSINSSCSGACAAGSACPAGSTNATTMACSAGFMCPLGSPNATALRCPAGQYSLSGAATCSPCPVGRYGEAGTGSCEDCPAGRFGPTPGATSAAACTACAAGFFGGVGGLSTPQCSGLCPAGHYCQGEEEAAARGCTGAAQCVSPLLSFDNFDLQCHTLFAPACFSCALCFVQPPPWRRCLVAT